MDQNERRMIDDLFAKLRQAEQQAGPRDREAEQQIADALSHQPAAPYYMSQVILIQDQAMQALHQRIQKLEQDLAERPAGGGGFLGGLFGGATDQSTSAADRGLSTGAGGSSGAQPATGNRGWSNTTPSAAERVPAMAPGTSYAAQAAPANRGLFGQGQQGGSGFMGSALQTAAGVAGGMLLVNAMSGLFGSQAHAAELPDADGATGSAHTAGAEESADAGHDDPLPADDFYSQDDLLADNSGDFETFDGF